MYHLSCIKLKWFIALFWGHYNEIIEKLNEEIVWMKGHHKRCIAAKTVDTTMSVAGTAVFIGAVITAPFQGCQIS